MHRNFFTTETETLGRKPSSHSCQEGRLGCVTFSVPQEARTTFPHHVQGLGLTQVFLNCLKTGNVQACSKLPKSEVPRNSGLSWGRSTRVGVRDTRRKHRAEERPPSFVAQGQPPEDHHRAKDSKCGPCYPSPPPGQTALSRQRYDLRWFSALCRCTGGLRKLLTFADNGFEPRFGKLAKARLFLVQPASSRAPLCSAPNPSQWHEGLCCSLHSSWFTEQKGDSSPATAAESELGAIFDCPLGSSDNP